MFWLRQIFRVRERWQDHDDAAAEMGIIDHLEALRSTIIRMALTLLAAMVLCFGFSGTVMSVLRQPVESVWVEHERRHLPDGVSAADWVAAKSLAALRPDLSPGARAPLEQHFTPEVRQLADIVPLLHAAALLPAEQQAGYLNSSAADDAQRARG